MSSSVAGDELYRWRRPDSLAHSKELAKMIFYVTPMIWGVKLYDDHWASRTERQAEIHQISRRARGDWAVVPIPLPRIRKRALTGPLPPIESLSSLSHSIRRSRQRTDGQGACLLLTMLPLELRRDIYDLILLGERGAGLVHIMRKHGRFGHWRCRLQMEGAEECDTKDRARCLEGWLVYKARAWHLFKEGMLDLKTDGGIIPLLLTCRAIYTETIQILYSKNIFHFYDPGDILHFGKTLLPQRLNSITSIVVDWERPFSIFDKENSGPKMDREEFRVWSGVWSTIAGMENLMDLQVVLKKHKFEVPHDRRQKMCEPMMEIKGLRRFELVIPWDDQGDWEFAEDAPFTVIRSAEPVNDDDST